MRIDAAACVRPHLDERRQRLDLHRFGQRRRLQRDRHVHLIADRQRQVRVRGREARELHRQVIDADRQILQPESAAAVGDRRRDLIGIVIPDVDGRAGHDRFARVADGAGDARRRHRLRGERRRHHQQAKT